MKKLTFFKICLLAGTIFAAVSCNKDNASNPLGGYRLQSIVTDYWEDSTVYVYNSDGRLSELLYYDKPGFTTTYVLQADNMKFYYNGDLLSTRKNTETYNSTIHVELDSFYYDPLKRINRMITHHYYNGSLSSHIDTTFLQYNAEGQLQKIKEGSITENFYFTNGNITKSIESHTYYTDSLVYKYDNKINPLKGNPSEFPNAEFFNSNNESNFWEYTNSKLYLFYSIEFMYSYRNGYPVQCYAKYDNNVGVTIKYYYR